MDALDPLGEPADHAAILANRERRAAAQRALLQKWGEPLISFSLTIPGPARDSEAAARCFAEGLTALGAACAAAGMICLERALRHAATGPEALVSVKGEALTLKRALVDVEETHPVGRLFDLDVLAPGGDSFPLPLSLGRAGLGLPPRGCLVCERPAVECRRAGRHSPHALYAAIRELLLRLPQE